MPRIVHGTAFLSINGEPVPPSSYAYSTQIGTMHLWPVKLPDGKWVINRTNYPTKLGHAEQRLRKYSQAYRSNSGDKLWAFCNGDWTEGVQRWISRESAQQQIDLIKSHCDAGYGSKRKLLGTGVACTIQVNSHGKLEITEVTDTQPNPPVRYWR